MIVAAPSTRNTTVLVVDDDADLQDALGDVLSSTGYSPAFAGDGQSALEYLRSHEPPALILLDLMMPRMDGIQFRAEQRADPALADIPVVVLSADSKLQQKLKELMPAGHLAKPVSLDRLLEVVGRFCGAPPSEK